MSAHTLGIIIIVIFQVITSITAADCTEEAAQACWDPMTNLSSDLGWNTIVPTLSEENMREHCRLFDAVEACLLGLQCNVLQDRYHQGYIDAYKWLCDEAFDVYLNHRECYASTQLHAEGAYCNKTLTEKLDNLDSSGGPSYRFQRICQYSNDYLDCVENAVKSFCGQAAADWQREFDRRSIQPMLSLAGCKLDSDGTVYYPVEDKTKTYIIIGCIVALTLVLILIIIVVILMYRRNLKSRRRRPRHEHGMASYSAEGGIITSSQLGPSVQAGPLPPKEPPPYDGDAPPPEYTPTDPQKNYMNGYATGMQPAQNDSPMYDNSKNGRPPSVVHSKHHAPSQAGSVYSGHSASGRTSSVTEAKYRVPPSEAGSGYSRGIVNPAYDDVRSNRSTKRDQRSTRQSTDYF